MPPPVLSPRARRDLEAAARRIATDNPESAMAFTRAAVDALRRIGSHPMMAASRPTLAPARDRFMRVPGFPYLIVYDATESPLLVARVIHMAHDLPKVLSGLWSDER